jgi:aldehyde:ferredoxin oxidoreductase
MSFAGGYTGKVLEVDMSSGQIKTWDLPQEMAELYLGGKGFGARILYDRLSAGVDPLSPENMMVFAPGPLTGSRIPSTGRFEVCTKSPATGFWLDCNAGGSWGPELKYAGYDALVITGASDTPKLLLIEDAKVQLIDADDLWGQDALAIHRIIKEKYSGEHKVSCIGQGGERLSNTAGIITEYRALGRGGAGAVMGSKGLKAIAVRGTGSLGVADPELYDLKIREAINELANNPDTGGGRRDFGTNLILSIMDAAGLHPVHNFQKTEFEGSKTVNEDNIARYWKRHRACFGCPIRCSKIAEVDEGPYKGSYTEGPEYEASWSFGAQCGNSSVEAIIEAERLCDEYGLDSISVGNTIGFLMECKQRGLIGKEDLGGLDLDFGNSDAMVQAVHLMGKGEGHGKLWAQGTRVLSQHIEGSEDFAINVKGLELPAYDPRGSRGIALAYATSDRGGCHLRSWPIADELLAAVGRLDPRSWEFKAEVVKTQQDMNCLVNCSGFCLFATFALTLTQIAPLTKALTGIEALGDAAKLMQVGERVNNLVRLFNLREGLTPADDDLPARFKNDPIPDGPNQGQTVDVQEVMPDYYLARGWDSAGVPSSLILNELGLKGDA